MVLGETYYLSFLEDSMKKRIRPLRSLDPPGKPIELQRRNWEANAIDSLLQVLPKEIQLSLKSLSDTEAFTTIIAETDSPLTLIDEGGQGFTLDDFNINIRDFIDSFKENLKVPEGSLFAARNKIGIPGTLHSVTCTRDRRGNIIGLTYKVGIQVQGITSLVSDLLQNFLPNSEVPHYKSILVVGLPGTGKTTLLREISYKLSSVQRESVVVVDSYDEITGRLEG